MESFIELRKLPRNRLFCALGRNQKQGFDVQLLCISSSRVTIEEHYYLILPSGWAPVICMSSWRTPMLAQRFVTTLSLLLGGFAMAQDVAPTPAPSFGSKEDPKIKADKPSSPALPLSATLMLTAAQRNGPSRPFY